MKNSNTKIKLIARVMLIVLLLASAVNFVGCTGTPDGYYDTSDFKYYLRQENERFHSTILKMFAVSDKNIFDIDDITINLLYGTHANKYIGRQDLKENGIDRYSNLHFGTENGEYVFALYICDYEFEKSTELKQYGEKQDDIENIANHKFIKSIDESEAFTNEYAYAVRQYIFSNFYLKHIEQIIIPSEYINNDTGAFVIKFVAFFKETYNTQYLPEHIVQVVFEYEKIDNDTVKIKFMENGKQGEGKQ